MLTLIPATIFATFSGNGEGVKWPSIGISRVLEHTATKFQRLYPYVFGIKLSSSGTADVMGRRCVLEIQDDSQIIVSIKAGLDVCPSVRPYVRPSTKSFSDSNEI